MQYNITVIIILYYKYIIMGVTFREIPKFRVSREYNA